MSIVIKNKKANFDYQIKDKLEAGLVLEGWEVKAILAHRVSLAESYIVFKNGEAFWVGATITPLNETSTHKKITPLRQRKLLLNVREIDRSVGIIERQGLTCVPLSITKVRGRLKLNIGIAQGKNNFDKRQSIKEKEQKRDLSRALKNS